MSGPSAQTPVEMPAILVAAIGSPANTEGAGPAFLNPGGFASAGCDEDGIVRVADERLGLDSGARLDRLPFKGQARVSLLSARGRTLAVAVVRAEAAGDWPLADAVRLGQPRYVLLACLPPSLSAPAAAAFGLTGPEARVTAGLVQTGDIRRAAERAGVTYETARKLAKSAMRKAGVRRQGELVGLWVALQTGEAVSRPELLATLTDLFPVNARQAEIAAIVADGASRKQAAEALAVSEHTIKAELKAVFAALDVPTVAALSVLINEIRILSRIVQATSLEAAAPVPPAEPLRLIPRIDRPGRIAVVDHGPRNGAPVLLLHTATTSRHHPQSFIRALQAQGIRPIALDRPGFGLTNMIGGDYLAQSAQDLADILDTLGIERTRILARGGTVVMARFAERWPERVIRAVIVNPEPTASADRQRVGLTGAVKGLVYSKPWLIGALVRYLGRNASAAIIERLVLRALDSSEADRRVLSDPEIRAAYIQATQQAALQGGVGFLAVASSEPMDRPRQLTDGSMMTIVCGSQDPLYDPADSLPRLQAAWPGCDVVIVPDAGRLVHFQKPDLIAGLLLE